MKKRNITSLMMVVLLIASLITGCGNNDTAEGSEEGKKFTIGINQFLEHPALDAVKEGFDEGLSELDINVDVEFKNAQGDLPNASSISQKFIKDDVDLIFSIATPVAQATKQATSEIPIIFSAVTDPVDAGLVDSFDKPGGNITGTSDESPIDRQLQLFKDLDESIETVGIIYSTGEANSQIQIERATEIGKEIGIKIETIGITEVTDIQQAADSIMSKVDAIYTITDNKVASAINLVAEKAKENGLITIGGEEAHVAGGILMTDGISYHELGKQSAQMAFDILVNGKDVSTMSCEKAESSVKVFNKKTLEALGLDIENPVFKDATELKPKN